MFAEGIPVRAKDFSQSCEDGPRMFPSMKARPGHRVQPATCVHEVQVVRSFTRIERTSFISSEYRQMSMKRCFHISGRKRELHARKHVNTHLREPGFEQQETIETGTRAAALGGYTAVSSMANTDPVTDHASIVSEVREKAAAAGLCDVFPVGAITRGLEGESLAELGEMVEAGVRMFSDDGHCVPDAWTMRNALIYAKAFTQEVVIADHCEDASLVERGQMHEGLNSYTLGLAGRPAEAEEIMVARDLALARATGGRLHICHVSCARSVDLVRQAKAGGVRVTAEVTPHHLVFTDDDLLTYDTNLKVNPPIRTAEDRDALRSGLADGTIDAVATDHAPHSVEDKEAEFDLSAGDDRPGDGACRRVHSPG